jgi:hypothetical protein
MGQVIRLKASFPKNWIQSIRLDNDAEFSSKEFNDYYTAQRIQVQHFVSYVHTKNGLAKSLIKRIVNCETLTTQLQFTYKFLGSCSFTHHWSNLIATNCIS